MPTLRLPGGAGLRLYHRPAAGVNSRSLRSLLVAVGDAPTCEIVRGDLDDHPVTRKDSDVVHANLARDGAEDGLTVFEFDIEHRVRQRLYDLALELDCVLFAQT